MSAIIGDMHCMRLCYRGMRKTRGLCHTCYNMVRVMVARGETTWEREIAEGRALPKRKTTWNDKYWRKNRKT